MLVNYISIIIKIVNIIKFFKQKKMVFYFYSHFYNLECSKVLII